MARRYTYETTLDLRLFGDCDVKVTFEYPDRDLAEDVEVISIDGVEASSFMESFLGEVAAKIEDEHQAEMIQKAIKDDAEARIETEERIQERKAELAGWR